MTCEEMLAALNDYVDGERLSAVCEKFAEHLAGALELFGGDLDTLGQLGFEFGGLEGLLVELLRVGPGRLARRLAEVPAAFGGHPAGGVDTFGERGEPEPRLVGGRRRRGDLG